MVRFTHHQPKLPVWRIWVRRESVSVMKADRDWGGAAFRPAPWRQLLTVIAGTWHVATSRGTERTFGVGQSLLVEDISGPGHSSRALEDGGMALVTVLPAPR